MLRRSGDKDFAPGAWECVTGRVDQGESFEQALHREVWEEVGVRVQVDFIIGTTHFYRGDPHPENELLGVLYGCSLVEPADIQIDAEHSEFRWVSAAEAESLLREGGRDTRWIRLMVARSELLRRQIPPGLIDTWHETGFEL
jgi:8-oxo-dGTP diphosphatase